MRVSKTITGFATIGILLASGAPTIAKQLKGDEITKLLVGNTVEFKSPRNTNRGTPGQFIPGFSMKAQIREI